MKIANVGGVKLQCVKLQGEQWAPQIEVSMAKQAMEIALSERKLGRVSVSRTSSTGVEYTSVFEVTEF
jgi:hypothetical protein